MSIFSKAMDFLHYSENERKRDQYEKLYKKLEDKKAEHDRLIQEAEDTFSAYKSSMPCVPEDSMPFHDFLPAQERLDSEFSDYIEDEREYRSKLDAASSQAYERYLYYNQKAIDEDKED
ncbi:hypothetical protein SFC66_06355 [Terribacillus saccharophilus]|uniref:hypothetical protein n=1 Tax=Terribacillus saccharophilus TaxID=361277 RepID=UPI0039824FA3